MSNKTFNLKEAAEYLGVCRQAVWIALTKGRISYKMIKTCGLKEIAILKADLVKYKKTKYNRQFTVRVNGKLLCQSNKGLITMKAAAEISNIGRNSLYYAVNHGKLPYEKIGSQYVFRLKDIEQYAKNYWKIRTDNEMSG